jgi:hypothetical protein
MLRLVYHALRPKLCAVLDWADCHADVEEGCNAGSVGMRPCPAVWWSIERSRSQYAEQPSWLRICPAIPQILFSILAVRNCLSGCRSHSYSVAMRMVRFYSWGWHRLCVFSTVVAFSDRYGVRIGAASAWQRERLNRPQAKSLPPQTPVGADVPHHVAHSFAVYGFWLTCGCDCLCSRGALLLLRS